MRVSKIFRPLMAQQVRHQSTNGGPRDYAAAVAALNTLQSNFSIVEAIKQKGTGWQQQALPEMREWVRRIGYEVSDFDKLNPIHIAGTKGKGSTSAFISSILAQYLPTKRSIHAERLPTSVGLYASPHLRFVRERIKINDRPISEDLFAKCFWEVWDRLEANPPPDGNAGGRSNNGKPVYFHYLTLMALHCFLQERVGSAVIECGIGGEYDTTNILHCPSVTGVTSLGIDHQGMLGDALSSIAWHKAGIFKPSVPAFTAPQPDDALQVLRQRAKERKTELFVVPHHAQIDNINLGLQGQFQKTNASLAIAISAAHLQRLGYTGVPDPYDHTSPLPQEFVAGLETARLGGRCDKRTDVVQEGVTWYIDGGHTLESIEVAAQWFASATPQGNAADRSSAVKVLIFNQQTRDAPGLAQRLHDTLAAATGYQHPFDYAVFCPNVTSKTAGYKPDLVSINTNASDITSLKVQNELAKVYDQIDDECRVHVLPTIEEAVERTRAIAGDSGKRVECMVTGSLHLVGGLIDVLESEIERGVGRQRGS